METNRRLNITVYDKDLQRVGWVSNPVYVTVTERWRGVGSGEVEVESTDPILEHLMAPGARVVVAFDAGGGYGPSDGVQVLSGPVRTKNGSFVPQGTVTVQVQDDARYLRNMQAYVAPSGNVKATSTSDFAQTASNPLEVPLTGTIRAKLGRWQWPSSPTVLPAESAVNTFLDTHLVDRWFAEFGEYRFPYAFDFGRGPDVRSILPSVRFQRLEEVVYPLLDAGGLGLQFRQGANTIEWDIFEPDIWPAVLTPDSGVIRDGEWSLREPEATHVVVGGPGEEAARAFRQVDDQTGIAETYKDIIDVFRNATGAPIYWPDSVATEERVAMYYHLLGAVPADRKATFEAFLLAAGAEALADGAAKSGLSIDLQESEGFKFGGRGGVGFATGDMLTVAASTETALQGLTFTDRITETTLTMTATSGVTVSPVLGQKKDDTTRALAAGIKLLAAQNRRVTTNQ